MDRATCIQETSDGGFIAAGWTGSNDGDVTGNHGADDFWVVKLEATGAFSWQKTFGGTNDDQANSVQQTSDGGYIVAGWTASNDGDVTGYHGAWDWWVVKLDALGTMVWQLTLGGSAPEKANSIRQTIDGGYIVAGWTGSNDGDVSGNHGVNDVWVVKVDPAGGLEWQKALGGSYNDGAFSIRELATGELVVAGQSDSNDGDVLGNNGLVDYWIVNFVPNGGILWQEGFGGSYIDIANTVNGTTDGGYFVAGSTTSSDGDVVGFHGNTDGWALKLDAVGNPVWQRSLGGTGADDARSAQQTVAGGYVIAGRAVSNDGDVSGNHGYDDAWVVMLDAAGNLDWQKCLGGSGGEFANAIEQTSDGGFVIAGSASSNDGDVSGHHGNGDFWVVKLDSTNTGAPDLEVPAFTIAPNPSEGQVLLRTGKWMHKATITLTDALGCDVLSERMNGNEIVLDLRERAQGLYLITLRSEEGIAGERLVVE